MTIFHLIKYPYKKDVDDHFTSTLAYGRSADALPQELRVTFLTECSQMWRDGNRDTDGVYNIDAGIFSAYEAAYYRILLEYEGPL